MFSGPVCSEKPPEVGGFQDWSRVILKRQPVQHPPASIPGVPVLRAQGQPANFPTSLLNSGCRQLVRGIRLCPSQAGLPCQWVTEAALTSLLFTQVLVRRANIIAYKIFCNSFPERAADQCDVAKPRRRLSRRWCSAKCLLPAARWCPILSIPLPAPLSPRAVDGHSWRRS